MSNFERFCKCEKLVTTLFSWNKLLNWAYYFNWQVTRARFGSMQLVVLMLTQLVIGYLLNVRTAENKLLMASIFIIKIVSG